MISGNQKHRDHQKREPAHDAEIITVMEMETVECHWCDGEGLVTGVCGDYHTQIPCVYCKGLGTLQHECERKYIVLPDGQRERL
jgi:hypothetical protein